MLQHTWHFILTKPWGFGGQGASGGESGLLKRDGELYQIQVGGSLGAGSMTTWYVLGTKITHKQMLKPHYAHTVPSNIIHSGTNLHLRNKCQSTTDCFTEEEITQPPNTTSPSAHWPWWRPHSRHWWECRPAQGLLQESALSLLSQTGWNIRNPSICTR